MLQATDMLFLLGLVAWAINYFDLIRPIQPSQSQVRFDIGVVVGAALMVAAQVAVLTKDVPESNAQSVPTKQVEK